MMCSGRSSFALAAVVLALGASPALAQNQPPTSTVTDGFGNTVNDGDTRVINEGDWFALGLTVWDPDGDALTVTVTLADASGVDTGEGSHDAGTGQWTWSPGQGSRGTYTVTIEVCDAEFCVTTTLHLVVNSLDPLPTTPLQAAPTDGWQVGTFTPTLVVDNAYTPDLDPITYDFQLYYYADPGSTPTVGPDQEITGLAEGSGGQTSWTPVPIPENTRVYWRVRSRNGVTGIYSLWSGYHTFFVNTVNDPPIPPILTKPTEASIVLTRSPTLEANNTTDPEGDAIDFYFEVATDDSFTTIVQASPAVPQVTAGTFTTWTDPAVLLDWGTTYAARAYAVDANGAVSGFSNVNHFRVTGGSPPPEVSLGAPFSPSACTDVVLAVAPMTITVSNAVDPEGELVTLDLEIYDFGATPGVGTPVQAVLGYPQDTTGMGTVLPVDTALLVEDSHYRVRVRASDSTASGPWSECDFWLNTANGAPGALAILQPTSGTVFPWDTQAVTVTVQNATDPESELPGSSLSIQLCASFDSAFGDCDPEPKYWYSEPSIADPALTTDLLVTQLIDGILLGPGITVHLLACAMDDQDECGPADSTDFMIEWVDFGPCDGVTCATGEVCEPGTGICVPQPDPCDGVSCSAGEACDPATGSCVAATCSVDADCLSGQTCVNASCVTPARCESSDDSGGCARDGTECAVARDGEGGLAAAAVFLLLAFATRRRRRDR